MHEFTLFFLRWVHFLAGVTWIGILYYFNFVQTPFFAETDPAVRTGAIQKLLPRALWWFRWGAMFTFLAGILIYIMRLGEMGASVFFCITLRRDDHGWRPDGYHYVPQRLAGDLAQSADCHGFDESGRFGGTGATDGSRSRAPRGSDL